MMRWAWSTRTSGRAASMPSSASATTSCGSLMSFFMAATLQTYRPLFLNAAVLPDRGGDQPCEHEQGDDCITDHVQVDVRDCRQWPASDASLLGQNRDQLDASDDQGHCDG